MQLSYAPSDRELWARDASIGRIVSVNGSKAVVLLDSAPNGSRRGPEHRPEMGTLLVVEQATTSVLAIVSALCVPVPAQREGDNELWIAELGLVGELWKDGSGNPVSFNRGVTIYPALGDRVRVASRAELEMAFYGNPDTTVRVGSLRQDSNISAMVRVDDLLGKHFAILGTTGTGKSCTTALILRAILQKNPAAHIVLLDPHSEYATAFGDWAEVLSPRNLQLPFWLLTFEEVLEVLIGDTEGRKAEVEILQELIPIAKARYAMGRAKEVQALRRGVLDPGRFTVDTPVPYRISDLIALIDERMGKLENKRDLHPYRQIKTRLDTISQDARYAFMFGSLTVYDGMAQILGQIFRVPVNNKPLTILELTGVPSEVVNVVVSVLCRMTFDFALWSEGQVPVTLVCEEAHRYVPANPNVGFEPCRRAIARIAKEGRKYGASLCIVTQRPAEIDPTILSQCNTVFALRMSNDRDQQIVQSAVSDTGSGLLEFLPALGQREAIAFGDGVSLPVRIIFDELPRSALPRSSTARFSEKWQKSVGDEGFLDQIVERWRSCGASIDASTANEIVGPATSPAFEDASAPVAAHTDVGALRNREMQEQAAARGGFQPPASGTPATGGLRREGTSGTPRTGLRPTAPATDPTQQAAEALRSLRERLMRSNSTR